MSVLSELLSAKQEENKKKNSVAETYYQQDKLLPEENKF